MTELQGWYIAVTICFIYVDLSDDKQKALMISGIFLGFLFIFGFGVHL